MAKTPQNSKTKKSSRKWKPLVIPRDDQKAIDLLNAQDLRKLLQIAQSKSPFRKKAAYDLKRYYTRIANIANKRLKALEQADRAYYAYDRLQQTIKNTFTGKRLVTGKKMQLDTRQMYDVLQEALLFTKSQTSTVEGIEEADRKRIESFRRKGLNIPVGQEQLFLDFLGSSEWNGISQLVGSDVMIYDMGQLFEEGNSMKAVQEAFNKVISGKREYEDALEDLGYLI